MKTYRYLTWFVLLIFLAACGSVTPSAPTATSAPTFTPVPPTATALPTETPAPMPTVPPAPTPPPPFPLDGYVMVFDKDGDLYFQDGNNAPVQLTHGGEKANSPIISDDNQKIVFFRGESSDNTHTYSNIYSVNTDGSQERVIVTPQWLAQFGDGVGVDLSYFVPGTHQLLFEVFVCGSEKDIFSCANGLFIANVDTGKIRELVAPGLVGKRTFGWGTVSPNGKMIVVVLPGQIIDVLGLDGKIIRQNIFPYSPNTPIELSPDINWLPNSQEMLVALPVASHFGAYTVWRYSIDSNTATQIPLDPTPAMPYTQCYGVIFQSPDGNWGLYNTLENELYLWDIRSNIVQRYATDIGCSRPSWSPDSIHFIYQGNNQPYILGSVLQAPVNLGAIESPWWIDATHFIYVDTTNLNIKTMDTSVRIGEIVGNTILAYNRPKPYLLIKPKR